MARAYTVSRPRASFDSSVATVEQIAAIQHNKGYAQKLIDFTCVILRIGFQASSAIYCYSIAVLAEGTSMESKLAYEGGLAVSDRPVPSRARATARIDRRQA